MFFVRYSEGSNARESEEQAYIFYSDFLDACEGKIHTVVVCINHCRLADGVSACSDCHWSCRTAAAHHDRRLFL